MIAAYLVKMDYQLTALVVLSFIAAVTCDCQYTRYSEKHAGCLSRNPDCNIVDNELTNDDKLAILEIHNQYRDQVARGREIHFPERGGLPTATNMLEMEWDDELAVLAQKRAETCKFEKDCDDCLKTDQFDVSQNLFRTWFPQKTKVDQWERMVKQFYSEIQEKFKKEYVTSFKFEEDYARFSQLIWAQTWMVGCGKVVYQDEYQRNKTLVACNYGPRGNLEDQPIYEAGDPCSNCPTDTCCGAACDEFGINWQFSALCKNTRFVPSVTPEPQGWPKIDSWPTLPTPTEEDELEFDVCGISSTGPAPDPKSPYAGDFHLVSCSLSATEEPPTTETTNDDDVESVSDEFRYVICKWSDSEGMKLPTPKKGEEPSTEDNEYVTCSLSSTRLPTVIL